MDTQKNNSLSGLISNPSTNKKQKSNKIESFNRISAHYYLSDNDYFMMLKTMLTVPSIPKDTTGNYKLYLFPALQARTGGILKPMLFFDSNRSSWFLRTLASAPSGSSVPHQQGVDYAIPEGTEVTAVIKLIKQTTSGLYTYKVYFEDYPEETSCKQTWNDPASFAFEVFEPDSVTKEAQYPEERFFIMADIELITNHGLAREGLWETYDFNVHYLTNNSITFGPL
ncbi:hypothetical protein COMNV_00850 [Commensalibacter sp. Nvir]|uniref:hypothetical protein n=1 Tax=Commensalibacter sp. Nvir TaxID=3069817 RepID=UPI002D33431C|nr:hypothetical protein COMNV_00850 [Commensalibacter sp. Nvir]